MPFRVRLPASRRVIGACPARRQAVLPLCIRLSHQYSTNGNPLENPKGPNQDVLGHVSEEASAISEVLGEEGPELDQGTPVEDVLKRDSESKEKAPEIIKDEIKKDSPTKGSRAYSTLRVVENSSVIENTDPGYKFDLPELPIPREDNIKHRYNTLVEQVTNLMMKHGKKSVAQRNMSIILAHLRTAPSPAADPRRPLLPGSPPTFQLPLNPILYLQLAIDSVAPLLRIRTQKGAAGGGVALPIPVPLGLKQRRRRAIQWILDSAEKRPFRGSGKGGFAQRVAEEIISVVEGRSSVWEKRNAVHKLGVAARATVLMPSRRR